MLITNSPSASVCLSIAWVLVMFSLVRETRDCCANQQCNVSVEKYRFLKTFQLRAWLKIYTYIYIYIAQNKTIVILNKLFKTKILSG